MSGGWRIVMVVSGMSALVALGVPDPVPAVAAEQTRITVLATSDLRGHLLDWDYAANAPQPRPSGLARLATLVEWVRESRGPESVLLLDNGNATTGTELTHHAAVVEPGGVPPVAAAFAAMGYDATVVGAQDFGHGLPALEAHVGHLTAPVLGANVVDLATGSPARPAYTLETLRPGGTPVRVGVIGLTSPGAAVWQRPVLWERFRIRGLVDAAATWVPVVREAGAEVVVVLCQSGVVTTDALVAAGLTDSPENACAQLAQTVPGIDVVIAGQTEREIPEFRVRNAVTGDEVVITQPGRWGEALAVVELELTRDGDRWRPATTRGSLLRPDRDPLPGGSGVVTESPTVTAVVADRHRAAVGYASTTLASTTMEMSLAEARYADVAVLDLVGTALGDTVREALAGTPDSDLPVLAVVTPYDRTARLPVGPVTRGGLAAVAPVDSGLLAVTMTGRMLHEYLEWSARYFGSVDGPGPHSPDEITNAPRPQAPYGTPDQAYDVIHGLRYRIDLTRPVGERVDGLSYQGEPVATDQVFAVAVTEARRDGTDTYPHVRTVPRLLDTGRGVRQAVQEWVTRHPLLDPTDFAGPDWELVAAGEPVLVEPPV